jgi:hypothetical protein
MFYLPVKGSFLPIIWTVLKSLNYDKIKISWEMESTHDDFLFQIVMVDDSSNDLNIICDDFTF